MTAAGLAVALMTADHNNMDDEARKLVASLDRDQLELVALMLAGWATSGLMNEACDICDDYTEALAYVDSELASHGLDFAGGGCDA